METAVETGWITKHLLYARAFCLILPFSLWVAKEKGLQEKNSLTKCGFLKFIQLSTTAEALNQIPDVWAGTHTSYRMQWRVL